MIKEGWNEKDMVELRRLQRKYKQHVRDKTRVRKFSPKKYKNAESKGKMEINGNPNKEH